MLLTFYNYNGNANEINKNLANETNIDCHLKANVNVTNVALTLKKNISDFNFNYCYIPAFNRYYFINSINILSNELIEIELTIDVLFTYKNSILKAQGNLIETQNSNNANEYDGDNTFETTIYKLNNPFNDYSDILITAVGK